MCIYLYCLRKPFVNNETPGSQVHIHIEISTETSLPGSLMFPLQAPSREQRIDIKSNFYF